MSEASVNDGIVARQANTNAAPEKQYAQTAKVPPQRPSQALAPR